jgi:hypothetical protein
MVKSKMPHIFIEIGTAAIIAGLFTGWIMFLIKDIP